MALYRLMLGAVTLRQKFGDVDGRRAPTGCPIGLVAYPPSLRSAIVPNEKPAIAVGTRVNQDFVRHETTGHFLENRTVQRSSGFHRQVLMVHSFLPATAWILKGTVPE